MVRKTLRKIRQDVQGTYNGTTIKVVEDICDVLAEMNSKLDAMWESADMDERLAQITEDMEDEELAQATRDAGIPDLEPEPKTKKAKPAPSKKAKGDA